MSLGPIKENTLEMSICRSYNKLCLAIYRVAMNGRRISYTCASMDKLKKNDVNETNFYFED